MCADSLKVVNVPRNKLTGSEGRAKGGRNAAAAKENKGLAAALDVFQESADDADRICWVDT